MMFVNKNCSAQHALNEHLFSVLRLLLWPSLSDPEIPLFNAIRLFRPVFYTAQETGCQHLAQLDPFLIERIDIPRKTLKNDLRFVGRQQGTHDWSRQTFGYQQHRGAVPGKPTVGILIRLAYGQGH